MVEPVIQPVEAITVTAYHRSQMVLIAKHVSIDHRVINDFVADLNVNC